MMRFLRSFAVWGYFVVAFFSFGETPPKLELWQRIPLSLSWPVVIAIDWSRTSMARYAAHATQAPQP